MSIIWLNKFLKNIVVYFDVLRINGLQFWFIMEFQDFLFCSCIFYSVKEQTGVNEFVSFKN